MQALHKGLSEASFKAEDTRPHASACFIICTTITGYGRKERPLKQAPLKSSEGHFAKRNND